LGPSTSVVPVIGDHFAFFLGSALGAVLGDALHSGSVLLVTDDFSPGSASGLSDVKYEND
jgi:hypothetical protein